GDHLVALAQPLRSNDVGPFAVLVTDQRDERRAIGVVLQPLDRGRHIELAPLEIDPAVGALVSTAPLPDRDAALVVAAARPRQRFGEALHRLALPQGRTVDQYQPALARRPRIVVLERHRSGPTVPSSRRSSDLLRASPTPSSHRPGGQAGRGNAWS